VSDKISATQSEMAAAGYGLDIECTRHEFLKRMGAVALTIGLGGLSMPSPGMAAPPAEGGSATSFSIDASTTSATIGSVLTLSGVAGSSSMIGKHIMLWVQKPGKGYWTYLSNPAVSSLAGEAAWKYECLLEPGMARGDYAFMAALPSSSRRLTSSSRATVSVGLE
jgi:hypothetical protein